MGIRRRMRFPRPGSARRGRIAAPFAIALVAGFASGQSRPASGGADEPAVERDERGDSTYVNEAFDDSDALRRFEGFAARGEWSDAVSLATRLCDASGDRVCRRDGQRYVSVRREVLERIAGWPAEGRAVYARRIGAELNARLQAARSRGSVEELLRVAESYYPSPQAADAVEAAAQIAFERAEFAVVRQWMTRLLESHPQRTARRELWSALRAIACLAEGDRAEIERVARELGVALDRGRGSADAGRAGPRANWAGREVAIDELLRGAIDVFGRADHRPPARSRRESIRTMPVPLDVRPEAVLWEFDGFGRTTLFDHEMTSPTGWIRRDSTRRAIQGGRLLAFEPVLADGCIVLHDHRSVWAIEPGLSAKVRWRVELAGEADANAEWVTEDEPPPTFTTSAVEGCVLVHLDRAPPDRFGAADSPVRTSSLVCLDARAGRRRWQNDLEALRHAFTEVRLDGAPILVDDRLIAVARRRKPFGFEACFLVAFDPASGRTLWTTHVGEAPTGGYGYHRATQSHLGADGDTVFVQSNLGTVAAVGAAQGIVRWLRVYAPAIDPGATAWPTRSGRHIRSWHAAPPVIWRDRVIVAPLDADEVMMLDQHNGDLVASWKLSELGGAETMVGVHNDRLYLAGTQVACLDLAAGKLAWKRPISEGELFGRAALASTALFVPTSKALLRYPLDGGPVDALRWGIADAGNLLLVPPSRNAAAVDRAAPPPVAPTNEEQPPDWTEAQIIVASPLSVRGIVSKADAFARLDRAIAAAPGDANAPRVLAERAIDARDYERGVAAWRLAVERAGGLAGIRDELLRRPLFETGLRLARSLMRDLRYREGRPMGQILDQTVAVVRDAGQISLEAQDQVEFRLLLAEALVRRGDSAQAVDTLQQVLLDPSLRRQAITVEPGGESMSPEAAADDSTEPASRIAGDVARERIERLTTERGPGVYERVQRLAEARLAAAAESNDAEALGRVAESFPNSPAAPRALGLRADVLSARGDHAGAAAALRAALEFRSTVDRLATIRMLVDCLARAGQADAAADWMDRAIREFPGATVSFEGQSLSLAEYRARRLGPRRAPSDRPEIGALLRPAYRRSFDEPPSLLCPAGQRVVPRGLGMILLYANQAVDACDVRTGSPVWPRGIECRMLPSFLGLHGERIIFATRYQIFGVDRSSGRVAWTIGNYPAEADAPGVDPEWIATWEEHAIAGGRLFSALDRGELICADLETGQIRWRVETKPRGAEHLVATEGLVAYSFRQGRSNHVVVRSAKDGSRSRIFKIDDDRAIQTLLFAPDGRLLAANARTVCAFDVETGRECWRGTCGDRHVTASIQLGPDGLYAATETGRVIAYRLDDGRPAWQTEPFAVPEGGNLRVMLADGVVYVFARRRAVALDAADGRTLAERSGDDALLPQADPETCFVLADSLLAFGSRPPHDPDGARELIAGRWSLVGATAASAAPPELLLGRFERLRDIVAADGAVLVLDGQTLIGYVDRAASSADSMSGAPATSPWRATSQPAR